MIYVGKAKNLRDRVSSYFSGNLLTKTQVLVSEINKIDHVVVQSEIDAFLLEANLIKKYLPKYNLIGKDDKSFPYIEITKDKIPLVKIVREKTAFGPYPPGSDTARLLRFLRRIFPYVSEKHKEGKICLRANLGLCPCNNLDKYPKNLKNLKDFLSGKRTSVQKKLEREMTNYSKDQDYESALEIKKKLEKIAYLTAPRTNPWEYEINPNLVSDLRSGELEELEKVLEINKITKIEAYDISNTSGKLATGSQVVFIDGEPQKKFYRRYKIAFTSPSGGPDDFAMLSEMLSRRLKSDIPLPQLFVIDGGKGQVEAIASLEHNVKTIGLAKRLETIYTDDGKVIQLPLNSPALHLLQRLRDEAHRFSRKYHFFLRKRNMLT